MMIGFHVPSPFDLANSAAYGEPGWSVTVRPRPGKCVLLSTPCATFGLSEDDDPAVWTDHPGEIAVLARLLIALGPSPKPQRLDAAQVARVLQESPQPTLFDITEKDSHNDRS